MRTLFVFWILMHGTLSIIAQGTEIELGCLIPICNSDDCGDVQVSFSPEGENVFCEGEEVTFRNTSSTRDFEFFIFSFGDGTVDTVFNYDEIKHTYTLDNLERCEGGPKFDLEYCYTGFKECGNNLFSCSRQSGVLSVILRPTADFDFNRQVCVNTSVSFTDLSCYNTEVSWEFGDGETSELPNPRHEYSTPGAYTVTLSVTNECGMDQITRQIQVVEFPVSDFDIGFDSNGGCIPAVVSFNNTSSPSASTFWRIRPDSINNTWCFTDTFQTVTTRNIEVNFKDQDEYLVELVSTNACGEDRIQDTLLTLDVPFANIQNPGFICESSLYTPEVSYINESSIESVSWSFENGEPDVSTDFYPEDILFNTPGSFQVRLDLKSECRDTTYIRNITISTVATPEILNPPIQYCDNEGLDTLIADIPGGIWMGDPIIDQNLGVIDPKLLNVNASSTITYQLGIGECARQDNIEVTLLSAPVVTISEETFCFSDDPTMLSADIGGGIWTGRGVVDDDGLFDPSMAGAGMHTVYYLVEGVDCNALDSAIITVDSLQNLSLNPEYSICRVNEIIELEEVLGLNPPSELTLTWSGNGIINDVGSFNSNIVNNDTVLISLIADNGICEIAQSFDLILQRPQDLSITPDSIVCIQDQFFQLTANVDNGRWSGRGVNQITGEVDLQIAGDGEQLYSYVIFEGTTCESIAQMRLTIEDLSLNLQPGDDQEVCEGPDTFQLSGASPDGGVWRGPQLIDSIRGIIDLQNITPDSNYNFQYCLASSTIGSCSSCVNKSFRINALPNLEFEIDSTICVLSDIEIINRTTDAVSYNWNFGNGIVSTDQSPLINFDLPGRYNISLEATSSVGCITEVQKVVDVVEPPFAEFDIPTISGCEPFEVDVSDMSVGFDLQSRWIIGDNEITFDSLDGLILEDLTEDTTFAIKLIATNICGSNSDSLDINVFAQPNASFGFNVDEGCTPLPISFANTATGSPESYRWDLGNGTMTSDSLPLEQVYINPGEEPIQIVISQEVENQCGTDRLEKFITVNPPDVTAFIQLDTLSGCPPLDVGAGNFSTTGSQIFWEWYKESDDVQSSIENDPSIVLTEPGVYTIVLSASQCGTDTDSVQIQVLDKPQAAFSSVSEICLGDTIPFVNESIDGERYRWDFGDEGRDVSTMNATHSYRDSGDFEVTLITYNEFNCTDTSQESITVRPLPNLEFDLSESRGCPPLEVVVLNQSSGDNLYNWVSSSENETSLLPSPTFTFITPGSYEILGTARNSFNCQNDTILEPIIVHDVPVADFELADETCIGQGGNTAINLSAGAVAYQWYIGGSLSTTSENLEFTPVGIGDQQISLEALNQFGCKDSLSKIISILPSPIADFELSQDELCLGDVLDIVNNSSFTDRFELDLDDGNSGIDLTTYSYRSPGIYEPVIIATSDNVCPPDSQFFQITVHPNPIADFEFSQSEDCGDPVAVTFTNNSEMANDAEWYLNGISQGREFNTIMNLNSGTNEVELVVFNEFACSNRFMEEIEIFDQPFAEIEISEDAFCVGETLTLSNIGSSANQVIWSIDDLGTFSGGNIDLTFDRPGEYQVTLILANNSKCQDSLSLSSPIIVYDRPEANFSFIENPLEQILGEVQFENESIRYDRILWDFGDGNSSQIEDPLHIYNINGPLTVTLTAFNENNGDQTCTDVYQEEINPEDLAKFYAPNALSPDNGTDEVRVFKPTGIGILSYDIYIYSPWGELIWHSDELDNGTPSGSWDGTFSSGTPAPQGVYVFKADVIFMGGAEDTYTGSVHLIR